MLPGEYQKQDYAAPKYKAPGSYIKANNPTKINYNDPGNAQWASFTDTGDAKTLSGGDYSALENAIYNSRTAGLGRQEQVWRKAADEDLAKRGIYSSGVAARTQNDITERLAPQYQQAAAEAANQRYNLQSNELGQLNQFAQNRANQANTFQLSDAAQNNQYALARADQGNSFRMADANRLDNYGADQYRQLNAWNQADAASANNFNLTDSQARNAFNTEQAKQQYESQWRPADYKAGLWNGTGGIVSSSSGGGWSI